MAEMTPFRYGGFYDDFRELRQSPQSVKSLKSLVGLD